MEHPRETRPLPALAVEEHELVDATQEVERGAQIAPADASSPDDEATVVSQAQRPPASSRPRRTTLASMTRPRGTSIVPESADAVPQASQAPRPSAPSAPNRAPTSSRPMPSFTDEIVDEIDEWSVADQATVVMAPRALQKKRPNYLETGELQSWPPAPVPAAKVPRAPMPSQAQPPAQPPTVQALARRELQGRPTRVNGDVAAIHKGEPRLASPGGRLMPPTPPMGVPRAALPNPRMQRFQELRAQRVAHGPGERGAEEGQSVGDAVRQWWNELAPGLAHALHYQHEARASGMHPIPAYENAPATRLGDAFGRLATTAREMAERAQSAAAPALKRLHDQAEHAAQALIEKLDGNAVRQQAPFLGPGRVAIFFRPGVTVGQAQRLLAASSARPLRIIPRKHGFLALVRPGTEEEVAERLRGHPYVRDVAYLDYGDYSDDSEELP